MEPKPKAELTQKSKDALKYINDRLIEIKEKIPEFYKDIPTTDERGPERELILFIRDKHKSPWRKQTEDIEGDVDEMRAIST